MKDKILQIINSLAFSIHHIVAYSGKDTTPKEIKNLYRTLKKEQKSRDKLIKLIAQSKSTGAK